MSRRRLVGSFPRAATSVPSPTPCPLAEGWGYPVFLSGDRTGGGHLGKFTWPLKHPLPGGITQPLSARQEESQLAERKNPHLTARGSQQLPDSVGRESLCTLESTWVWKEKSGRKPGCGKRGEGLAWVRNSSPWISLGPPVFCITCRAPVLTGKHAWLSP